MNLGIFYDTETSGMPLWSEPSDDPRQPHIVELAAIVADLDTRKELLCMSVIVSPDGWTIPDDVAAIHGITTERAYALGIPEDLAVNAFLGLWSAASVRIGHNESFDARILRIAVKRHVDPYIDGTATGLPSDAWKSGQAECTARMATPICNLPPTAKMIAAKRNNAKTPNLGEAYEHLTGRKLEGAHRALTDARACMEIYFGMCDLRDKAAA